MTDPVDDLLAAGRPATAADREWAASAQGQHMLTRIQARFPGSVQRGRQRRRRWMVAGTLAGALTVGAVTAGFWVLRYRAPVDETVVACARTASITADLDIVNVAGSAEDAIAACAQGRPTRWPGEPSADAFILCTIPAGPGGDGGARIVFPVPAGTDPLGGCLAAGAQPAP